jgi:hypothetical protein
MDVNQPYVDKDFVSGLSIHRLFQFLLGFRVVVNPTNLKTIRGSKNLSGGDG